MSKWILVGSMLLTVTFASLVLQGCGGMYRASYVRRPPLEERERVVYKNFWMKTTVGVLSTESEDENGFLKAKIKFKNLTFSLVNADIKVKFLDSSGYEIDDTWGWTPLPLESGEIKTLMRVAPSKKAVDYRVLLKLADEEE